MVAHFNQVFGSRVINVFLSGLVWFFLQSSVNKVVEDEEKVAVPNKLCSA